MNAPLIIAGCLALLGAGIHGIVGDRLVVQKLSTDRLEPSRFGGPRMTLAMIHVTWHITTVAFVAVGCALLLAGTALDGAEADALAVFAAAAATGFAAIMLGVGMAYMRSPRHLIRHGGPLVFVAIAALAWAGAL